MWTYFSLPTEWLWHEKDLKFSEPPCLIYEMAVFVPAWHICVRSALTIVKGFSYKLCWLSSCCYYYFYCISGLFGEYSISLLISILCVLLLWVSEFLVSAFTKLRFLYFSRVVVFHEDTIKVPSLLFYPKVRDSFLFSGKYTLPQPSMIFKWPDVTNLLHGFWKCYMTALILIAVLKRSGESSTCLRVNTWEPVN